MEADKQIEGEEFVPFVAGPPITHPRNFFGRTRELKRLFNLWKGAPLQNAAVIGPRRSGKTSLLLYLQNITATPPAQLRPGQRADWLPQPERYRWVFVDFQNPVVGSREGLLGYLLDSLGLGAADSPSVGLGQETFAQHRETFAHREKLLEELVEHFNQDELRTLCFYLGVDYESLPAQGKAGKARELIAYLERSRRLGELVQRCCQLRPNVAWGGGPAQGQAPSGDSGQAVHDLAEFVKLVGRELQSPTIILLDEIDVALQRCPDLDDAFWEGMRSLATNYAGGKLAFVLAAPELPAQLAQRGGIGSPFFNIFGYTAFLKPLTDTEARELIASSPLPFPPADVGWILAQSGRWPLLLQILCRERLVALEDAETGHAWREEGLCQIAPFRHLLEA